MTTSRLLIRPAAFAAVAISLLSPLMAQDADYTATGLVVSADAPGLVYATGLGQVVFRNNTHTARVTASDARLTGRRRIVVDGAYNADGTAEIWGTCYQEVGAWNDAMFSPSGGVWELRYVGTMGRDNSLQVRLTGTGFGGAIEGLRLNETLTRGVSAAPVDVNQPYLYRGHITTGPTMIRRTVDDFQAPIASAWSGSGTGQGRISSTDGTLTVRGDWTGTKTRRHTDTWYWASRHVDWEVTDGRTLEWRVDLIGMTEGSTNAAGLVVGSNARVDCYIFYKGANFIQLAKYNLASASDVCVFFHENAPVRNTNVVLSLLMTRVQSNLLLTCRVLDKANPDTVLCQRTVVDTPQVDPTLTQAELLALSGMNLVLGADSAGAPLYTGDSASLDSWQYSDGSRPGLEVIYDNLEMRDYETPQLGIEPSVTLLVPASFQLQQASGVSGPWTPVVESALQGIHRISVSSRSPSAIFRAVVKP